MDNNYISIMIESLQEKIKILDEIILKNREQADILNVEETDWDAFDENADAKGLLIDRMDDLDKGFDNLFEQVKAALSGDEGRKKYAGQIKTMQELIRSITEKSVEIQASESRNKQLVEKRFAQSHQRIGRSRNTSRAAMDYYKNMQNTHVVTPAFLDSKK